MNFQDNLEKVRDLFVVLCFINIILYTLLYTFQSIIKAWNIKSFLFYYYFSFCLARIYQTQGTIRLIVKTAFLFLLGLSAKITCAESLNISIRLHQSDEIVLQFRNSHNKSNFTTNVIYKSPTDLPQDEDTCFYHYSRAR